MPHIYCPITNLRFYVAIAKEMGIDLKYGFLFRTSDRKGNVSDSPSVGSADRLRKHLTDLKILGGETVHSFRSGCSITLSLLGIPYDQVAKHVGWKSVDMAIYYSQYDKVMSLNAQHDPKLGVSLAELLGNEFRERNFLNGFKPLFSKLISLAC